MITPGWVRLVLVRHAESVWNVEERYQGQSDSGLTSTGRVQAATAADWLVATLGSAPSAVASSDLPRVVGTAAPYLTHSDRTIRLDRRLREVDTGTWSGRTFAEMSAAHPEAVAASAAGEDVRRGGGETFAELRDRVWAALVDVAAGVIASDRPHAPAVIFTHGGPIRVAAAAAAGVASPGHAAMGAPGNCSVTVIELSEQVTRSRLVHYNAPTTLGARASRTE